MPANLLVLIALLVSAACAAKNEPASQPAPQRANPGVTAPDPWLIHSPKDQAR